MIHIATLREILVRNVVKVTPILFLLLISKVLVLPPVVMAKSSSSSVPPSVVNEAHPIKIVFSDVDGTLLHYDETNHSENHNSNNDDEDSLIRLPPSSTGMVGVISKKTLDLCRRLREDNRGIRLVLVSGMRTSTLVSRLPFLPRADAYCSEGGGRIFYPKAGGKDDDNNDEFKLIEDLEWKRIMMESDAAGPDGYEDDNNEDGGVGMPSVEVVDRTGPLWAHAVEWMQKGWVIDCRGYATCFRMQRNRQNSTLVTDADWEAAIAMPPPEGLAKSTNLGCIDIYPAVSGKKNCCEYLAQKYLGGQDELTKSCVCLCDDENDIEMALACRHAFIPGVTSDQMWDAIKRQPSHFTLGFDKEAGREHTKATEHALQLILQSLNQLNTRNLNQ